MGFHPGMRVVGSAIADQLSFRVLGPLEVACGSRLLSVRGQKPLTLLALLLLRANQAVSVDFLVDELWPQEPPADPDESIQALVYQLRKELEAGRARGSVLERIGRGYRLHVGPDELDLGRFERLVRAAVEARRSDGLEDASWTFREALDLWRGPALANLVFDAPTGLRAQAARLDELRLSAMIERFEVELELGLEDELVGDLEALVVEHPLDERLHHLLMLALYRCGRQAEALKAFQAARSTLVEQLGIEPGKRLQQLQQAILRQDPELDLGSDARVPGEGAAASAAAGSRSLVVVGFDLQELDSLLPLGEVLGGSQQARELIVMFLVADGEESLVAANKEVKERRQTLIGRNVESRVAAFTSSVPADDIGRLAMREDVDLLLLPCPDALVAGGRVPQETAAILEDVPSDVGLFVARDELRLDRPVLVPFGGLHHDWAALELGAWLASAGDVPLELIGVRSSGDARDGSRILSDASLVVQQLLRISPDVRLVDSGRPEGFLQASDDAGLLVLGLPDRWRNEGIGELRLALAREARTPVLLVRKGDRPGGLAPRDTATVFAWSLMPEAR